MRSILCLVFLCAYAANASLWAESGKIQKFPAAPSIEFPVSSIGDKNVLVILADFADQVGTITQSNFQAQFFGSWPSQTLAAFYNKSSYGRLNLAGDVVGVSSGNAVKNQGSAIWVRLPNPKSYYSAGAKGLNVGDFPHNLAGVYYHALQQLEAVNFDFSPYVESGSNEVPHVIVIFAGKDSTDSGDANDFQAAVYDLSYYFDGGYLASNGQLFKNFAFCPELAGDGTQAPIGICAHELGHSMGQVDMYDISAQVSGAGYYDIMAYGLYGSSNGIRPFDFSPHSKILFGWLTPTNVRKGSKQYKLRAVENKGKVLKLVPSGSDGNEYFLIENRQFEGLGSDAQSLGLCKGIYIWHIDQNIINNYKLPNTVNTVPSAGGPEHPGIALVEADADNALFSTPISYGECSDVWKVGRTFGPKSKASSNLWNNRASKLSLKVLSKTGSVITVEARKK